MWKSRKPERDTLHRASETKPEKTQIIIEQYAVTVSHNYKNYFPMVM